MRTQHKAALLLSIILLAPASVGVAQDRGGVPTETQQRLRQGADPDLLWNILGLAGLFGMLGLRRGHAEDSYHPTSID